MTCRTSSARSFRRAWLEYCLVTLSFAWICVNARGAIEFITWLRSVIAPVFDLIGEYSSSYFVAASPRADGQSKQNCTRTKVLTFGITGTVFHECCRMCLQNFLFVLLDFRSDGFSFRWAFGRSLPCRPTSSLTLFG